MVHHLPMTSSLSEHIRTGIVDKLPNSLMSLWLAFGWQYQHMAVPSCTWYLPRSCSFPGPYLIYDVQEPMVSLGSFYHFRPYTDVYADDGSGSVTILEAYRALIAADFRPERTVEFHWYSAEVVWLVLPGQMCSSPLNISLGRRSSWISSRCQRLRGAVGQCDCNESSTNAAYSFWHILTGHISLIWRLG